MSTQDEYWALIDAARSGADDPQDGDEVAEVLVEQLARCPAQQILALAGVQAELLARGYGWPLWGAAYLAMGGCGDDSFEYFRAWLITRGRQQFEQVLADPDTLAGVLGDQFEDEQYAECEALLSAPEEAYCEVVEDQEFPWRRVAVPVLPDLGPGWDFDDDAEMSARYPRLWARFGED